MIDFEVDKKIQILKQRGVQSRMRVAFLAETSLQTVITLLALWRMGAVACPLNPRLPELPLRTALKRLYPVFDLDKEEIASCPIACKSEPLSLLLFTSGTTKEPKIAGFSLNNLLRSAHGAISSLALEPRDSWQLSLPLFHIGGIAVIIRCLLAQADLCFDNTTCTHLSLVPTQLYRLLREGSHTLKKAKVIVVGGAPLSNHLLQKGLEQGLPLYTTWGMTETSSMVTLGRADSGGHSGHLLPHRELKINEQGELFVRGETLFLGYLEDNHLRSPVDTQGWFATGDLGSLDAEGRLYWKGRKDHIFKSLGENIQPEEIEAIILKAPGIQQAVVIAVPDEECGSIPIAFIDSTEPADEPSLRALIKEHLSSFKMPRRFFPLQMSYGLKPSRLFLKQEALKLLTHSPKTSE
ncbi:MAG: AMP-binding protein [Simkania sp.]|nr:AMP-binding protein [Simkania sp.]